MKLRPTKMWAIGLAIVMSLGIAPATGAQADTTKSRVPVKKERVVTPAKTPAEAPVVKETPPEPTSQMPAAVRRDTATRAAAGEVVRPKDTTVTVVAAPPCAMTPTNVPRGARMAMERCANTPAQQPRSTSTRYAFGSSGFYAGVGAGTAVPFNLLSDLGYDSGFDLTIPIGWHRPGRTLGVRATLAFDQVHADLASADATAPAMLGSAPDPKIYSGTVDAVLKFPIGDLAREGRGLSLYTVGGGGVYLFRGFGGTTVLSDVLGNDRIGSSNKNVHKWGIQAGAGLEYGLGPAAVFVESRWVNVFTNGSRRGNDYLRWIPIGVGVMVR